MLNMIKIFSISLFSMKVNVTKRGIIDLTHLEPSRDEVKVNKPLSRVESISDIRFAYRQEATVFRRWAILSSDSASEQRTYLGRLDQYIRPCVT